MHTAGGPFDLDALMAASRSENLAHLAERLGVSKKVLRRMRATGLDDFEADRMALRLGRLPNEVWGSLWWDLAPPEEPEQLRLVTAGP